MLGTKENPFAGMITREKFEELVGGGCSYCSADVEWGDTGVTIIERIGAVFCGECSNADQNANRVLVPNVHDYM